MLRPPWILGLLLGVPLLGLPACGPTAEVPVSASDSGAHASTPSPADDLDGAALLEAIERQVAESIARVRESAVALEYGAADGPSDARRIATGVVVNEQGDTLSIRVNASAPIVARDVAGVRHQVTWVAADAETGLTLLRLDPPLGRPVRPALGEPRLGSQVLVVGNPFGLVHSVIRGQISGLGRRVDLGVRPLGGLIQVDAALHPGDSGALVANLRGEWLGLVRSGLAPPGAGRHVDHDLGFAIPAADALWIADQLRARHRVDRAYLGVRLDLGGTGEGPPGAVLVSVLTDSPAARGGLLSGDRIIALDGHPITTAGDLTDRLDRTPANAEAAFELVRGPRRVFLTVRTGRRPPVKPSPARPPVREEEPSAPSLPREVTDRIERLERRIRELEKPSAPASGP